MCLRMCKPCATFRSQWNFSSISQLKAALIMCVYTAMCFVTSPLNMRVKSQDVCRVWEFNSLICSFLFPFSSCWIQFFRLHLIGIANKQSRYVLSWQHNPNSICCADLYFHLTPALPATIKTNGQAKFKWVIFKVFIRKQRKTNLKFWWPWEVKFAVLKM